jgi:tape measure domain-containing protein
MSVTSEIRLRVKKEGDVALTQLSAKLNDVAQRSVISNKKFKDLATTLRNNDNQIKTKSINALNDYSRAWRELANSVDYTSKEFRQATREAQRFEQAAARAQGRRRGGGAMAAARGVGAVAASGIFGGPEGAIGALVGLPFGPAGAAVGGAIGAQVGQARQALGGTASYAADLQKQRLALQLVTKDAAEYERALKFISTTSRELAIPQDILTRQFTKLSASVLGAGGNVADTEKAFKGVTAGIRGTGGSLQDLDSALTATSQVFSKGKVSAEELRQQIGERLPGAFSLFAESLGMTPQELDKALEKGQVSLQDFQKFAEKLFSEYGDAAKTIADSPAAAGDRLKTALSNLSASVGTLLQPIGAAFQTTFANIANAISAAADELNRFFGIAGKAKMRKITEAMQREAANITRLENQRTLIKGSPSLTEQAKEIEPNTYFLDRQITQAQSNFDRLQQELFGLQAVNRAAQRTRQDKPKGLPSIDLGGGAGKTKGPQDISRGLAEAQMATLGEMGPIQKSILDFEAKILTIREAGMQPNKRSVELAKALAAFKKEQEAIGNKIAEGNVKEFLKGEERNQQILETIQNLEIEAGIIDQKQAKQLEKDRLIQQLQKDGATLTEEQLQRIDKAYEGINKKTSESMQLFKQIGQNVVSSLSDAFMSLFDQAKSLREVLTDLLRSTARLFVEFGLRAGMKSIFPSLFANGGIMTGNGPLPLKRYASGGIANSPQLAMFGEGSTPEAYVPLPDGRSIPVRMKGGGEMGNIVVNVDAAGSAVQGNQPDANKLGEALGIAVRQELIRQKRPGGLLA